MTSTTSIPGSKVGRARRELSQLWQVPTLLLGLLAFLLVAASTPWRHTPQELAFLGVVQGLRRGLDQHLDGASLVTQAEDALARLPRFPRRAAEVHFLAGSAYYRQGQQTPAIAHVLWPHAVEHLEQAVALGVSQADQPVLQYRLGYCLYQSGEDLPRALELMAEAVDKGAEHPLEGYQLLVQANLAQTPANLDGALSASRRILDLTAEQDGAALGQARLQHGELLYRKGMKAEALKELDRVNAQAPREVRIKARLLQARCCEEAGLWSRAIPFWQELLEDAPHVDGGRARIDYALGLCNAKMQPPDEAETLRAWTEALQLGGPAGQAAGLRLGELRLSLDENQAGRALADWRQALADVNKPSDLNNPYVDLSEVRQMLDRALEHFQEKLDAAKTQETAQLYRKIAPGGVAEKRLAQAAEAYARQLQDRNSASAAEVQGQYRRAAAAYEQAAAVCHETERPELLWRCGQCALMAGDNVAALKMLDKHVGIEKKESRLAESWNTLGDLYRMQGKNDLAHKAYCKCIEYGSTPFAYRARYYLAIEAVEKSDLENARAILTQNLDGDRADIDRPAHERSLFKMAWLLMQLKDYGPARAYLKDALVRYPENTGALLAREQLGECLRQLAGMELVKQEQMERKVRTNDSPEGRASHEAIARALRQGRLNLLEEAIQTYQGLADYLHKRSVARPLDGIEQILERRCLFGVGACHRDAGNFAEAQRVFRNLQVQHRRSVEGLFAGLSVCNLVGEFPAASKEAEAAREIAKESIRLLQQDLNDLKTDDEVFRQKDVPSRAQWLDWAGATRDRLMAAPKTDRPLPAIR